MNVNGNVNVAGNIHVDGDIHPDQDNTFDLGWGGRRWNEVWAANPFIQTSDERLKERIVPIAYGLREILRLRPVSFAWRDSDDGRAHLGLIAQEVEPLIPEAVRRGEAPEDAWAMTYSSLTPVLVKAIQDQQAIIEGLRERIESHEATN